MDGCLGIGRAQGTDSRGGSLSDVRTRCWCKREENGIAQQLCNYANLKRVGVRDLHINCVIRLAFEPGKVKACTTTESGRPSDRVRYWKTIGDLDCDKVLNDAGI